MKALQLIPELLVEDMPKTIRFYEDILGFKPEITFPEKDPIYVHIFRDNIHIMLYARSEFEKEIPKLKKVKMGGSILLYFKVKGIKELYKKLKGKKVRIVQPFRKMDYGSYEFTIEDCNGYLIAFSESISKK